jgi:predicted DNA-binding transcriptional regulator YafY
MSRASRLLQLIQVLRRHRAPVVAARLAEELQVSVRSIYRDIETLRQQGAHIEGEAGIGYLLRPGFLLPPLIFSEEELEALILGLRLAARQGDANLGRAAEDVAAKLRAVLPKELKTFVDETALLAGPAVHRPDERVDLAEVRLCIRSSRKARIDYEDKDGTRTERVVWPVAVGFFERTRVLLAWCESRADFRSFRVDRIATWSSLSERIGTSRTALLQQWREREQIAAQLPT